MLCIGNTIQLSASDLVGHLNCHHLTGLDEAVAKGELSKPKIWDPFLEILRERGAAHEQSYIDHLRGAGLDIVDIEGFGIDEQAVAETIRSVRAGADVIVQGALSDQGWGGRIDILRRVDAKSALGDWSYEVIDTKLARETKGGTVLQLCLYAELVSKVQGNIPEFVHVVSPWTDFTPQSFRTADYAAYFRLVKESLEASLSESAPEPTYPDPKEHCDVCRWRLQCESKRREDDHLCLVAGISSLQISELKKNNVNSVQDLARTPLPLPWKPERGAIETYERIREQARIQIEGRDKGAPVYETLEPEPGFGLACLPSPSLGDIFFDLEGDPFVGESGLEYLFGYVVVGEDGEHGYAGDWALTQAEEKLNFERFIDFVMNRWKHYPDLHVYHFAPYEPSALKRLMGRYATREEEIDRMLRASLFVDLYAVVRRGIRASVESYSIKRLEALYDYTRSTDLPDANRALAVVDACLELAQQEGITAEVKEAVESYNEDDCVSTWKLRDWLETMRVRLIEEGASIERPPPGEGDPSEAISEWQEKIDGLVSRLTAGVPVDKEERTDEQHSRWILANTLDWHRRESKAGWWEYFRLRDLPAADLLEERSGVAGLHFVGPVDGPGRTPIHRYHFPAQETDVRGGETLEYAGGGPIGTVQAISYENRTIDVKKRKANADVHPMAVFSHLMVNAQVLADSLVRIGEHVADHGLKDNNRYQAACDLIMRTPPRVGQDSVRKSGELAFDAAIRVIQTLDGGVLAIQGPPGAGKTYTGARMICELVQQGAKIGITANSHKVIRNLLDEVIKAAKESDVDLSCVQKVSEKQENQDGLQFTTKNGDVFTALSGPCQVAGGTAWLWSSTEAAQAVDVLFVDEAAQMSLANVLAVSQAGRSLVLLGDPQQLDQPMKGSHPDGTDVSALTHLLGGQQTIAWDRGLFLEETWRLHPDICGFTSDVFYEGRLAARPGLENQLVRSTGAVNGCGLRYLPVCHEGNQNASTEEADAICKLVHSLLNSNTTWMDKNGVEKPLGLDDILLIAPYNAQVFEIEDRLPGARIGTVDKFQGQEAPIVIYSMATSTPQEAPHGMEFLYSLNRLNVATSRARCLCILVGAPELFEPDCRMPRQMQLANAFCRYKEMASVVDLKNV